MEKLPAEILFDILSRLPLKTLCHCRYVSKAWYNTIKHPGFVDAHHAKAITTNSPSLIILENNYNREIYLVDHQSLDAFETNITTYKPKLPVSMRQIYSSNGLIFSRNYPYSICNPVTGEKVVIPSRLNYFENMDARCGFGFAPQSKVFKVVRLIEVWLDDPDVAGGVWRNRRGGV